MRVRISLPIKASSAELNVARNASSGDRRDAFQAGNIPDAMAIVS